MRMLITGARGLVGYHVSFQAFQKKHAVFLTSRGPDPIPEAPYHPADLTQKEEVQALIEWAQPEVVIHSAAMTLVDKCQEQPALCWQHNVQATHNILQALIEKGAKAHVIFVSTDFVYDGYPIEQRPYIEGDYEAPLSVYGASKLAAEALVKSYPGRWAIARTALVYGTAPTLERDNILLRVLYKLQGGNTLALYTDQIRTPTWVNNLAQGLLLLAEKQAQGVYHIAGADIETPYSLGQKIARTWGLREDLLHPVTMEEIQPAAPRPAYSPLSIQKARALGYNPHPTEEVLKQLCKEL